MKCEIIEVWAEGYKRKAYIKIKEIDKVLVTPISDETYYQLKNLGVPTAQSRRKKK